MLILLACLIVAAYVLVEFVDSERGRAYLLDLGFRSRYEPVQREIGDRVVEALRGCRVDAESIKSERARAGNGSQEIVILRVAVPANASFIRLNSEIDRLVRSGGGMVRSCREGADGRTLTMEIGTRRTATHRCILKKDRRVAPAEERSSDPAEIALIVDDFGYFDNRLVRDFLSLDIDLTISVIPGLRYSERICREASDAGKEVLCHLPMEPERGAEDSGEIPLVRVDMSASEIKRLVRAALETVPGASGMNNHMGSKATADRRVSRAVLEVCRERGIFFIDSMTTPHSVIGEVARETGVASLANDMFLDNRAEETGANLEKLLSIALRRGRALAILHVRRESLAALRQFIERARGEDVRFVKVSAMVGGTAVAVLQGG
jgi:polysaccharide deacetylase 2 family uncharacterized protein YibQ